MKLSQFNFKLPEEQIALYPHSIVREYTNDDGTKGSFRVTRRDEARLMVLHRQSGEIEMYKKDENGNPIEGEFLDFRNVLDYFDEGDTFILNDTKVFPARLYGTKEKTDAKIEVFICVSSMRRPICGMCWWSRLARSVSATSFSSTR